MAFIVCLNQFTLSFNFYMRSYPIYTVDAFTDHVFGGNPAAVCPLDEWLSTETMQQLANENNLSETAFLY